MRKSLFWNTIIGITGLSVYYLWLRFGPLGLLYIGISIPETNTLTEILKTFIETLAIIIAGIWTYERFIKSRDEHPYPQIQHRIEHFSLEKGFMYLSVFVTVKNEGKTKLDLGGGVIHVRQVSPMPKETKDLVKETRLEFGDNPIRLGKVKELFIDAGQRLKWVTLGTRKWDQIRDGLKKLEPGQTREIQFDFLLIDDDEVKVLEIISYFEYEKSSWELATLYSLA